MQKTNTQIILLVGFLTTTMGFQNCSGFNGISSLQQSIASSTSDATPTGEPDTSSSTPAAPTLTKFGVQLPDGFKLLASDRFGTAATQTVGNFSELHAKYYEAQFYNRDANGLVTIPNTVINEEQQVYSHFEDTIVFGTDHLTIQARGHSNQVITSAEMVSKFAARSWCVESKYKNPATDKAWPALWWYGAAGGGDASEIDIEQPNTPYQGVQHASFHNHPYEYEDGSLVIGDPGFTTNYMTWTSASFDSSAQPHVYTTCYDDGRQKLTHWIDGTMIYTAGFIWNKSQGGTGNGPDATTILNLAVGGYWPGPTSNLTAFSADMDIYYVDFFTPQ